MTGHDYAFIGFTALMALLLATARWTGRRHSPFHEPPVGSWKREFLADFSRLFKPLFLISAAASGLAMAGGVRAGFKAFLFLFLVTFATSLSFSIFKLFRFKYPLHVFGGGVGVLRIVPLYVVFTLIYVYKLMSRLNVL